MNCDRCDKKIVQKPAVILSPPKQENNIDIVQKYNICVECYEWLIEITKKK